MNAITPQNAGIQSVQAPTQEQLNKWVDEALELFRAEYDKQRNFTAWDVSTHLIAVYGGAYAIPHSNYGNLTGVRDLVHDKMEVLKNDVFKPYICEWRTAPDGREARFWIPVQPTPVLLNPNPVVITISKADGTVQNANNQLTAHVSYTVDGFVFIDN